MHIGLVMAGDEEGGLEKHVVELAAGLVTRGHQVSLIAHEKYRARLHPDIHFYAVNLAKSRRNLIVLFQLWYTLKQIRPDVVHVHGNKAAAMVGVLLRFLSVNSVATLHSRKKNTKMFAPFDQVIAVSQIAAESIVHPRVTVILNGIEPPKIEPRRPQSPPMVLAVGRLVPVKGFDVLIAAWRDLPAQLWIAGEGSEQAHLQQLIAQHQQQGRIQLLGQRGDIVDLMQQADLFVMSSHYEGCPYTMIEALLTRTPMLSTAVGAMRDILPAACLCDPNDPDQLYQLLAHALTDPAALQQVSAPVFAWASTHLTINGMMDQIETCYQGGRSF
jgi:glycosyltransferase involved in cell wall biosynthesis